LSFLIYFINEKTPEKKNISTNAEWSVRFFYRSRFAAVASLPFIGTAFIFYRGDHIYVPAASAACGLIAGAMGALWAMKESCYKTRAWLNAIYFFAVSGLVLWGFARNSQLMWGAMLWPVANFLFPRLHLSSKTKDASWFEPLLSHPARLLVSTFLGLIVVGTLLLMLPAASSSGKWIAPVDAAFTSVSAVCVTGLIVLDTPADFSLTGQFFILLLIQAGGLGIMTIATIALHALGKRFSLKQERVLATVSGDDRSHLYKSLKRVLAFTLLTESVGAIVLFILFYLREGDILTASWRGIFTSISAFCNAGFALQSNSLIDYQHDPFILHTVAALIILGGLSPAACAFIPDIVLGKKIPLPAFLVLVTTAALLITGTVFIAATEWNSTLENLSFTDKINNAWFQSATLRTAGFNSIDIAATSPPTYLIMLIFMFIGGSPGGTAGGIKTTTLAVFILCMSSIAKGSSNIVIKKQKIEQETVYKAIAVIGAGFAALLISIIALELTQLISVKDIVFEAVSALGTVGLSTGATSRLDGVGKVIIMAVMFLGRIGPLTMFMILSNPLLTERALYPSAKITIT
jgi:trk system potassium uptake protein TrkH